jgi:hypothetical protein
LAHLGIEDFSKKGDASFDVGRYGRDQTPTRRTSLLEDKNIVQELAVYHGLAHLKPVMHRERLQIKSSSPALGSALIIPRFASDRDHQDSGSTQ